MYELEKVGHKHREIVRRLVSGQKDVDIARELGVTVTMVQYTKNSPIVKRQLSLVHASADLDAIDVAKHIKKTLPRALELITQEIDGSVNYPDGTAVTVPLGLRHQAAKYLIEMSGNGPIKRIAGEIEHTHVNQDDLEEIKKLAKERAFRRGNITDAEIVMETNQTED